ncbi:MAG TPA: carboxymuconolactone decarboxylase family protein, partial [Pseudonocardiaceae bacterium]|nr:carboxymuconolactone decarboxylase family protein [Pseudonocardiaceae bacterium]
MSGTVLRTALRRSLAQIRYVDPVRPAAATGLVADVYRQMEDEFGMVAPPVALHSPAPTVLAATWLILRETLLAGGHAGRAAKEAVAASVSIANACPYCVEVHSTALRGLDARSAADAIGAGRIDDVDDPGISVLAEWARYTGDRARGYAVPAPAEQAPELVGVAATFHYLNRMVNVFLAESPLPPGAPDAAKNVARWLLAKVMRPSVRRAPGLSLPLLPDAPPAADLAWAAGNPTVAGAFARACAAVDTAAEAVVPEPVRVVVRDHLASWNGMPPGPSRAWVTDAVAGLPAGQRGAARLAL